MKHVDELANLGRVVLGVIHDFNNHLQAVMCHAQVVLQQRDIPPEARASAREILASCEACMDLTRGVMALASGNGRADRRLDVHEILKQIRTVLERSTHRRIHIQLRLGAGSAWVLDEKGQLSSAFLTIGLNALDTMPGEGHLVLSTYVVNLGEIAASSQARGLRPGRYLRVEITDTGVGIAEERLPFVFDPVFTSKEGGPGIGLAAARDAIVEHGGVIEVASSPGAGTTFIVHLPCAGTPEVGSPHGS